MLSVEFFCGNIYGFILVEISLEEVVRFINGSETRKNINSTKSETSYSALLHIVLYQLYIFRTLYKVSDFVYNMFLRVFNPGVK